MELATSADKACSHTCNQLASSDSCFLSTIMSSYHESGMQRLLLLSKYRYTEGSPASTHASPKAILAKCSLSLSMGSRTTFCLNAFRGFPRYCWCRWCSCLANLAGYALSSWREGGCRTIVPVNIAKLMARSASKTQYPGSGPDHFCPCTYLGFTIQSTSLQSIYSRGPTDGPSILGIQETLE